MHDSELKKLLLETCPVRPGQEARAWAALQERLAHVSPQGSALRWLYYPTWRGLAVAALALVLVPVAGDLLFMSHKVLSLATADSKAPGIYATAFYSNSAQAQVVWLDGMDPVSDKPTYQDPTSVIPDKPETPAPAGEPNSL